MSCLSRPRISANDTPLRSSTDEQKSTRIHSERPKFGKEIFKAREEKRWSRLRRILLLNIASYVRVCVCGIYSSFSPMSLVAFPPFLSTQHRRVHSSRTLFVYSSLFPDVSRGNTVICRISPIRQVPYDRLGSRLCDN